MIAEIFAHHPFSIVKANSCILHHLWSLSAEVQFTCANVALFSVVWNFLIQLSSFFVSFFSFLNVLFELRKGLHELTYRDKKYLNEQWWCREATNAGAGNISDECFSFKSSKFLSEEHSTYLSTLCADQRNSVRELNLINFSCPIYYFRVWSVWHLFGVNI